MIVNLMCINMLFSSVLIESNALKAHTTFTTKSNINIFIFRTIKPMSLQFLFFYDTYKKKTTRKHVF